jgi:hypothetical protein
VGPAMTDIDIVSDELALRRLAAIYAMAADRHDGEMYAGVFLADGRLTVRRSFAPDESVTDVCGHQALAGIPMSLHNAYDRTFHFVGQSLYSIGRDEATGTVYCQASHLAPDRGTSVVMLIHYEDRYRRREDQGWRIEGRTAWIDWTETVAANQRGG